ncbi:pyridoxamine 5 -phosphate oxidase [Ophiostoma piceae UAMH 11346]|uniref:pyridoxal 5'-phosphate synthase n=1 Tax=Ophiostoma piceae (strain UAMH 11346) TaxID=1262450 RepID=S3CER2_OPHP1|nr:pyridoxamine 5 -phosphate oxidase [Ophiostoma piceae UAMH 11346]
MAELKPAQQDDTRDVRALLRGLPSLKGPYEPVDWESFPDTPNDAFVEWLRDAIRVGAAGSQAAALPYEPHAMTLSTVTADGRPDARVLILKNVDDRGWHFAAKAESPKGRQLQENAACSLTFYWSALGRQVRIQGHAHPLPAEECAADFLSRPVASRISALASRQSEVMADYKQSAAQLAHQTKEVQALFNKDPNYISPGWLVYAVYPTEVEFWQGATDRQHGRLRYVRDEDGSRASWKKERLWP